jgi:diguanylate cyclase (GGDEF)-like protein
MTVDSQRPTDANPQSDLPGLAPSLLQYVEATKADSARTAFFHRLVAELLNARSKTTTGRQICEQLRETHQLTACALFLRGQAGTQLRYITSDGEWRLKDDLEAPDHHDELAWQSLADSLPAAAQVYTLTAIRSAGHINGVLISLPSEHTQADALEIDSGNSAIMLGVKLDIIERFFEFRDTLRERHQAEQLQRALFEISELSSGADRLPDFLAAVHRIVGELMYAKNFFVALYDDRRKTISFPYFVDEKDHTLPLPGDAFPLDEIKNTGTFWIISHGKPLHGTMEEINARIKAPKSVGSDSKYWVGVPLFANERVVGALVTQTYDEASVYTDADRELLLFVSRHISDALQRKRAREELEREVEERTRELASTNRELRQENQERQNAEALQSALFRIAELTSSSSTLSDFFASIHDIISELLYAANCYIALISDSGNELNFAYHVDEKDHNPKARKLSQGLTEYVLRTGRPTLVDQAGFKRLEQEGEVQMQGKASASESWLGVPLQCNGEIVGVLAVQSYDDAYQYNSKDQELLTFVSHHISNALERKRSADDLRSAYDELEQRVIERTRELDHANARLRHENLHDALTELPNRTLFMERLGQALERQKKKPNGHFAVLFLDLDRFKIINDSLGHLAGDELLVQVGQRIRTCMRSNDTIARLGGDEFAVLLGFVRNGDEAALTAKRIIKHFAEPFEISGQEVFTSTSIGIAVSKAEYDTAEEILRDADAAMYHAKSQGRRNYALFDESLHTEALSALEIENELRRALQSNEIHPHYQPLIELGTGRVIGFEALARWQHPNRGLVSPAQFVPIAEDTGLITELDWHIFEQACAQLVAWNKQYPDSQDMVVSVNFSSEHFRHFEFPNRILDALRRHHLPTRCLNIEMTESAMIGNFQTVKEVFSTLREAGVRLSLDDFGTGYSSLSYLHRFPVDHLKIEKSFVNKMDDNRESYAIIQTIRALAASLGVTVIAEGIETAQQYKQLRDMGCQLGQGFYMSKPLPKEQAEQWVADSHWQVGDDH